MIAHKISPRLDYIFWVQAFWCTHQLPLLRWTTAPPSYYTFRHDRRCFSLPLHVEQCWGFFP